VDVLIPLAVGLVGVVVGGLLTRRNEKKGHGERFPVEALIDAVTAIADVPGSSTLFNRPVWSWEIEAGRPQRAGASSERALTKR
jgi:hypothetical protein